MEDSGSVVMLQGGVLARGGLEFGQSDILAIKKKKTYLFVDFGFTLWLCLCSLKGAALASLRRIRAVIAVR